jgi:putative membrane protein
MVRNTLTAALLGLGLLSLVVGCDRKEGDRTSGTRDQRKDQTGYRDQRTEPGAATTREASDQQFVTTAAQANLAEIETGRIATERASNPDVKKFAQQMIEDHGKANRELSDLAGKKGFTVPEQTSDDHRKMATDLAELQGADFDRKYVGMMVKDHVKAVALFEENAKLAKDADLRAFAEKMTPDLKAHLKTARNLAGKIGAPPSAD